jgi:hypothetical protein
MPSRDGSFRVASLRSVHRRNGGNPAPRRRCGGRRSERFKRANQARGGRKGGRPAQERDGELSGGGQRDALKKTGAQPGAAMACAAMWQRQWQPTAGACESGASTGAFAEDAIAAATASPPSVAAKAGRSWNSEATRARASPSASGQRQKRRPADARITPLMLRRIAGIASPCVGTDISARRRFQGAQSLAHRCVAQTWPSAAKLMAAWSSSEDRCP